MKNIITRVAWTLLLAGLSLGQLPAQTTTNISGSSNASGACGSASVGNDVYNYQLCITIIENNQQSRPATIRLTDSQMERFSDMIADRVAAKIAQIIADRDREYATGPLSEGTLISNAAYTFANVGEVPALGGGPLQASSSLLLASGIPPLENQQTAIGNWQGLISSSLPEQGLRLNTGSADAFQAPTFLGYDPTLVNSLPTGSALNSTSALWTPPAFGAQNLSGADSAITGTQTLIRIDTEGLKSTVFGVLSHGNVTLAGSGDVSGGTLRLGADGSLELSGTPGIFLGSQPPASTSLYVATDGIVKFNGVPLTVDYGQSFNSLPSNTIASDSIGNAVPLFPIAEHGVVLSSNAVLPAPSLPCNLGGILSVSANGTVAPCALTLPSADTVSVPSN